MIHLDYKIFVKATGFRKIYQWNYGHIIFVAMWDYFYNSL